MIDCPPMTYVRELYWHSGGRLGPDSLTKFSAALVEAIDQIAEGEAWDLEQRARNQTHGN